MNARTVTLVAGRNFCLSDRDGTIRPGTTQGLFVGDVRVVDHLELLVDGKPLEMMTATLPSPERCELVGRGSLEPGDAHSDLLVIRRRALQDRLVEEIEVRNYAEQEQRCRVELLVGADFADLCSVKGCHPTDEGRRTQAVADRVVELAWHAGDAFRRVRIVAPEAQRPGVDPLRHRWHLVLAPGEIAHLSWDATTEVGQARHGLPRPPPQVETSGLQGAPASPQPEPRPRVLSDPDGLEGIVARSTADLDVLQLADPALELPIIAAGAPWFKTLFGRDALISSWMALPLEPQLALGVLEALALLQGDGFDAQTEEEPGRILHEVRFHRADATSILDGDPYYGTIDAPPLFVCLLGELHRWGVPLARLEPLLAHADRALGWLEDFGDLDGDGLIEYARRSPDGQVNQGWKDSCDGIRFRDGSIAEPPIALCEVQGYVYAAYRSRAELARHQGEEALADRYEHRARDLADRFDEAFWLADEARYAMALDRGKQPVDGLGSNPGLCLWSGIVRPGRAAATATQLVGPELWSGWGVRTLGTANGGYNPMSYHCGSVWPHDSALAAEGLRRYGFDDEAAQVVEGLMRAARANDGCLPELICGLSSTEISEPVPYPTSCEPQAGAAASPWLMVRTLLGLQPDVPNGVIHLAPHLPEGLLRLRLENLRLGDALIDIEVDEGKTEVHGLTPDLTVVGGNTRN